MGVSSKVWWGGAIGYALSATDHPIDRSFRFHRIVPSGPGFSVKLPDPSKMQDGGPWFALMNAGADSFAVKDHNGTSLGSLPAGYIATIWLYTDGALVRKYTPNVPAVFAEGGSTIGGLPLYYVYINAASAAVNLRTLVDAQGYAGVDPIEVLCYVNATCGSGSPSTPAFRTGSFPTGSVITVEVNSNIDGHGGNAGDGAEYTMGQNATDGEDGGNAFTADVACTVRNNGRIYGGGGGGGGGGLYNNAGEIGNGGGGGGGQGRGGNASGGPFTPLLTHYAAAGTGSPSGAGAGGHGGRNAGSGDPGTDGGAGGAAGMDGSDGETGLVSVGTLGDPGVGGAAGSAVEGDSLITWSPLGDVVGARNG